MNYEDYFVGLAFELELLMRPGKIKAIRFGSGKRVIYAAVEYNGFTSAVCATYNIKKHGGYEIDGDDVDGETEGSLKRNCPLSVLEKLSPLSECPYSPNSKQRAQQWRRDCLQRIIRSKRTSDADKAKAVALLQAS